MRRQQDNEFCRCLLAAIHLGRESKAKATASAPKSVLQRAGNLRARAIISGTYSVCGKPYAGHGNNAQPVNNGLCCDACDWTVVLSARFFAEARSTSYHTKAC